MLVHRTGSPSLVQSNQPPFTGSLSKLFIRLIAVVAIFSHAKAASEPVLAIATIQSNCPPVNHLRGSTSQVELSRIQQRVVDFGDTVSKIVKWTTSQNELTYDRLHVLEPQDLKTSDQLNELERQYQKANNLTHSLINNFQNKLYDLERSILDGKVRVDSVQNSLGDFPHKLDGFKSNELTSLQTSLLALTNKVSKAEKDVNDQNELTSDRLYDLEKGNLEIYDFIHSWGTSFENKLDKLGKSSSELKPWVTKNQNSVEKRLQNLEALSFGLVLYSVGASLLIILYLISKLSGNNQVQGLPNNERKIAISV